jgi:hypothetical protein
VGRKEKDKKTSSLTFFYALVVVIGRIFPKGGVTQIMQSFARLII